MASHGRKVVNASQLLVSNFTTNITKDKYIWGTSYAPYTVLCPATSLIREGNNVSLFKYM